MASAPACRLAGKNAPSYATVHAIIRAIDPALMVLAHECAKSCAHGFELLHRREATRPNEIWQADHTQLDILVLDEAGAVVRPWLTVIIDDHSRAVAAYRISPNAQGALQTALALQRNLAQMRTRLDHLRHPRDPLYRSRLRLCVAPY